MTWSHNDMWMLTADHGGYVKYWQSNMNNVKMFQAHKEAIREARSIPNLPFSVVNPRSAYRRRPSASSFLSYCSLCCSMLMSLMIDTCMCVLLQHCIDLSPVAHELCILDFSLHNHHVQKKEFSYIFFPILNKECTFIYMLNIYIQAQTRPGERHTGPKVVIVGGSTVLTCTHRTRSISHLLHTPGMSGHRHVLMLIMTFI